MRRASLQALGQRVALVLHDDAHAAQEDFDYALGQYRDDPEASRMFRAAAEIEGLYYGRLTRVEEVVLFAQKIGARKVGIATCVGLIRESQTFAKVLRAKGLEDVCAVACKVGGIDKGQAGIPMT